MKAYATLDLIYRDREHPGVDWMRNIRMTLAYEGTAYVGFQRQRNGLAVQAVVEEALASLIGVETKITGAGRTDAGVHALGQVINFRTESRLPIERFVPALNSLLPPDIAVLEAVEAPADFHARYDARSKTYTYRLWRHPVRPVFERNRAHHMPRPLALDALRQATRHLLGCHDFACFCSAGSSAKTTERTITKAFWHEEGYMLSFTVAADGFLYRMVRNIVGTLLQVGLGKQSPEWIGEVIQSRSRTAAGPTVPACGLYLVRVEY